MAAVKQSVDLVALTGTTWHGFRRPSSPIATPRNDVWQSAKRAGTSLKGPERRECGTAAVNVPKS